MNLIDIVILAVLIGFALKGLFRGLVNEVASLTGLILGVWLAYRYYSFLSVPIRNILHIPEHVAAFVAFMLLLIITGLIAHILGNIITTALRIVMLGSINRLGGLLIGAAEGALLLSIVCGIGTADFMPVKLKEKIRASQSASMFASTGDKILKNWRGRADGKQ
jgi:membrane protein required for colicin V production